MLRRHVLSQPCVFQAFVHFYDFDLFGKAGPAAEHSGIFLRGAAGLFRFPVRNTGIASPRERGGLGCSRRQRARRTDRALWLRFFFPAGKRLIDRDR